VYLILQHNFFLTESPVHIKSEVSTAESLSLSPNAASPVLVRTPQMRAASPETSSNKTTGRTIEMIKGPGISEIKACL
jgi:hypothetical protein